VTKDIALTLITRVVGIGAGLLISIVTARSLGPGGMGNYFFVITLANLAAQFGNLGMVPANTYYLASDKSLLPRLVANSLWISVVVGASISLLFVLIWSEPAAVDGARSGIALLWLLVPTMLFTMLASNLLIGLSRYREYNYFTLGSTLFRVAAVLLAAAMAFSVFGFLATNAAVGACASLALLWILRSHSRLQWRFDTALFRRQFGFAARSYAAALFAFGVSRAGVIILERFVGKAELGVFAVAQQFGDVLVILPATVALIFFPELLKGEPHEWYARTTAVAKKVAAIMLLACVATAAVAPYLIPVLFGQQFSDATLLLWWMLPGIFCLGVTSIFSQYLAAKEVPLQNIYVWVAGLAILIILGLFLVSDYGGVGIAVAISATYLFVAISILVLTFRMSRKDHNLSTEGAS
jgi:O-antigen/teichoic acid export membrane protein